MSPIKPYEPRDLCLKRGHLLTATTIGVYASGAHYCKVCRWISSTEGRMQVAPALKAAIIEVIEQHDGKLRDDKGGLAKLIYDMLPQAPWKPAPNNLNVVVKALEQLHDQGRIALDRRGRKLYQAQHQRRHDGPGNVIATPTELDENVAFEVSLVSEPEPEERTIEQVLDLVSHIGPHEVAKELLKIVVTVARTPQVDPAETDALRRELGQIKREHSTLLQKNAELLKQTSGDAAELRRLTADLEDVKKANKEFAELLEVAEAERDDWKRKCTEAAVLAAQYERNFLDDVVDTAQNMPRTSATIDEIFGRRG